MIFILIAGQHYKPSNWKYQWSKGREVCCGEGVPRLWHAARERDFLIITGMKSNHWLRIPDDTVAQGWRWQKPSDYAVGLSEQDFELVPWPR